MKNCPNCGAPLRRDVCDYCGTNFRESNEVEMDKQKKTAAAMKRIRPVFVKYEKKRFSLSDFIYCFISYLLILLMLIISIMGAVCVATSEDYFRMSHELNSIMRILGTSIFVGMGIVSIAMIPSIKSVLQNGE